MENIYSRKMYKRKRNKFISFARDAADIARNKWNGHYFLFANLTFGGRCQVLYLVAVSSENLSIGRWLCEILNSEMANEKNTILFINQVHCDFSFHSLLLIMDSSIASLHSYIHKYIYIYMTIRESQCTPCNVAVWHLKWNCESYKCATQIETTLIRENRFNLRATQRFVLLLLL